MRNRKYRSPLATGISLKINKSSLEGVEGKNLLALATPIFFEFLLINIVGNVDIIMLGKYSTEAVAAVGGVRQLLIVQNVIFGFICIGTTILISQLLGAQETQEVRDIIGSAILMNLLIAATLGGIYLFGYSYLLRWVRLPGHLAEVGRIYFRLVGGLCIFQALTLTFGAVMKAYGHTKEVFYINLGVHLLNILGNCIFIFGMLGMPTLGVSGVGISTITARGLGCFVAYRTMKRYCNFTFDVEGIKRVLLERGRKILAIGVPTGGQYLCWSFAQLIILSFVNTMGSHAIEARTYLMLIASFIIAFSLGLGQGTALQIGRLIGAGEKELVYRKCLRSTLIAFLTASFLSGVVVTNRLEILALFDPGMEAMNIAYSVFGWFIFLETGRVFNIIIIRSLHATGDIRFPAVVGIISPLVVAVSLAWILGISMGYGLVGKVVDFKNTLIIMTSNIGSDLILEDPEVSETTKTNVLSRLHSKFKPEFINRIDETIVFKSLGMEAVMNIVTLLMKDINRRLEEKYISLSYTPEALNFIATTSYDPHYGARPIKRFLQKEVETKLAKLILSGEVGENTQITLDLQDGELVYKR